MISYFVLFFFIYLFSILDLVEVKINKTDYFYIYLIVSICLFFFSILRYQTGFDYINYVRAFDYGGIGEPTFGAIVSIIKICKFSVQWLFIIYGILGILPKQIFFYSQSKHPLFLILGYYVGNFLGLDFGQIRQGVAVGIVFWAFYYFYTRKYKKYIIFSLLAILFHYSAIIPFLLTPCFYYFFSKFKSDLIKIFLLIICIIFAYIDLKPLISFVIKMIPGNHITTRLLAYTVEESNVKPGLNFGLILKILVSFIYIYLHKKIEKKAPRMKYIFLLYFGGVLFSLFFASFPQLSGRGGLYYDALEIFIYSGILLAFSDFFSKFILFQGFIAYYFFSLIRNILFQPESYIPFRTILEKIL